MKGSRRRSWDQGADGRRSARRVGGSVNWRSWSWGIQERRWRVFLVWPLRP